MSAGRKMDLFQLNLFTVIFTTLRIELVLGISTKYVQTKVFIENSDCIQDEFNKKLEESPVKSKVQCGVKCTLNEDCRRFMFDNSGMCSLYQSGENCITIDQKAPHSICYMQKKLCKEVTCIRCPVGFYGDNCENVIRDCSDGVRRGVVPNIRTLSYVNFNGLMEIKCDFTLSGFTMILHRTKRCLTIDFNRTKDIYASGFGHSFGNYWLGLQNIYELIQFEEYEYHIRGVKTTGEIEECSYSSFKIDDAATDYVITLGTFSRPSGGLANCLTNSLYNINGMRFSTTDNDFSNGCPGALRHGGWFLDKNVRPCPGVEVNIDYAKWYDTNYRVTDFMELHFRLKSKSV